MIFRPLILVVLLVILVFFVLQNQQPVALVFFGTKTIQLSLAVWVLSFIGAGVVTSLFLQLLYRNFGSTTPDQNSGFIPGPDPVSPPRRERTVRDIFPQKKEEPSDSRRFSETIPPRTDSPINTEWGKENQSEEWDIETPPSRSTFIREELRDEPKQEPSPSFEVQQQPKTTSRQGSVYSYGYREDREDKPSEGPSSDQIYDANYRVINPPYQENPPQSTGADSEDEDWV